LSVIDDEDVKTVNEEEGDENEYGRNGTTQPVVDAVADDSPSYQIMECYGSRVMG